MYKKFKKVFLVMAIFGMLFVNSYTDEVKEVQLIDDFSSELLGEKQEQETVVSEPPAQQQTQEITEDKNIGEEQIEKPEDKVLENINENKQEEIVSEEKDYQSQDKVKKDEVKEEIIKEVSEKTDEVNEIKEDKNLALEEPENPTKDKQKYEMIKYYSADGVEWELPDNFRAVIVGDTKGNVIFAKDADTMYPLASVTKMMSLMVTFDEINAGNISLNDSVRIYSRSFY